MIYTKALHKKVINANSSEKIAPTDGINPFPANASGCADGNYRMYVNTQALGSTATRTAEFRGCRGTPALALPGALWQGGSWDLERFLCCICTAHPIEGTVCPPAFAKETSKLSPDPAPQHRDLPRPQGGSHSGGNAEVELGCPLHIGTNPDVPEQ